MLRPELQLLEVFCAAEVAVSVSVDDQAEQSVSANLFFLTHRGHACMA